MGRDVQCSVADLKYVARLSEPSAEMGARQGLLSSSSGYIIEATEIRLGRGIGAAPSRPAAIRPLVPPIATVLAFGTGQGTAISHRRRDLWG